MGTVPRGRRNGECGAQRKPAARRLTTRRGDATQWRRSDSSLLQTCQVLGQGAQVLVVDFASEFRHERVRLVRLRVADVLHQPLDGVGGVLAHLAEVWSFRARPGGETAGPTRTTWPARPTTGPTGTASPRPTGTAGATRTTRSAGEHGRTTDAVDRVTAGAVVGHEHFPPLWMGARVVVLCAGKHPARRRSGRRV